jgi:uncharacterized protein YjiS (DUF1127 family)
MTAHTSSDRLNIEPPKMLSYHATWDDADYEPQFPARRRVPFVRLVAMLCARWQAARERQAVSRELAAMSAGELADMGITRHDLSRLFDPQHAPEFLLARTHGRFRREPAGSQ